MRWANTAMAELRKTATLPSAWAGVAVALLGGIAITILNSITVRSAIAAGETERLADTSAIEAAFAAMPFLGVVGAVVIGVIVIGSEYTADRAESGGGRQITTTMAAVPHRMRLFTAKMLVVLVFVTVTAAITIPANIALARMIVGDAGTETVTATEALHRSVGTAVYWVLMGFIAFAITVMARSSIIPLALLIANSSVVSVSLLLTNITPAAHWLPDMAGRRLFGVSDTVDGGLAAVPGGIVMSCWALALLLVAAYLFRRRDA